MNTSTTKRVNEMEKKHVTARLNAKLVEKVKKLADEEGRSLNNMIERLLEKSVA